MKKPSDSKAKGAKPAETSGPALDGSPATETPTDATVADREQAVLDLQGKSTLDTEASRGTSG